MKQIDRTVPAVPKADDVLERDLHKSRDSPHYPLHPLLTLAGVSTRPKRRVRATGQASGVGERDPAAELRTESLQPGYLVGGLCSQMRSV